MPDSYKPRKIQYYGLRSDPPDHRDFYFTVPVPVPTPPKVDLRPNCPPTIYNQGALGSCTANALAALYQYHEIVQKKTTDFMPSRLFIYYNERVLENSVNEDSGASLRDGMRALVRWGVLDENLWPYHVQDFTKQPTPQIYAAAKTGALQSYNRIVQKISDLRTCLASGNPFVLGIVVYDSFESEAVAKNGVVPMPSQDEDQLGGHAVLAVGYDDSTSQFIVRNSWGSKWGDGGYFYLPYEYVLNPDLTSDIWTTQMVP